MNAMPLWVSPVLSGARGLTRRPLAPHPNPLLNNDFC
jgi:hypothetical protein